MFIQLMSEAECCVLRSYLAHADDNLLGVLLSGCYYQIVDTLAPLAKIRHFQYWILLEMPDLWCEIPIIIGFVMLLGLF